MKILFTCHGNICRSPMAEFVMKDLLRKAGRDDVIVESAALIHLLACQPHEAHIAMEVAEGGEFEVGSERLKGFVGAGNKMFF